MSDSDVPLKVMVWSSARGGMRSVVEGYREDGFLDAQNVRLIASYDDSGFVARQILVLRALARFTATIATKRVALVHVHAAMRGSFWRKGLFASIARKAGIPVVLHLHGSEMKPFYASQPRWVQGRIRRALERATRVVVLSESWKTFIAQVAPAARIEVVPNYVRLGTTVAPESRDGNRVLFLGLVGDRKGVFDLIPAFAKAHAAHADARLTIAGNGELDRARAAIDAAGLDAVVALPGWTAGAAKAALLAAAGIYVLPSHNEGLPMSVLEAMAEGLAVVTTRVGGIPELITDDVDGLLVDAGDQAGLAVALDRLLADEALRQRIAIAGRARIEAGYSDAVILPKLSQIYEECQAI